MEDFEFGMFYFSRIARELPLPPQQVVDQKTSSDPLHPIEATTHVHNGRTYRFHVERAYLHHDAPFDAGMAYLERGNLSESILAFEESVQRSPDNARAWMWLGLAQAENDDDVSALYCLGKAVECDPSDLDAYMALATSATNELTRTDALHALVQWLRHNDKYSELVKNLPPSLIDSGISDFVLHRQVVEAFMSAARSHPNAPDPDVQIALGLLFNLNHEYSKAVDCFRTALSVRKDDYLLWNKLGATLANSSRSEEALGPYSQALALKPSYVRAQINVGVALLNVDRHHEAATHFLRILAQLAGSGNSPRTVDGVWAKLRLVLLNMDRFDLADKCSRKNVNLFRPDFEF
eukprot:c20196_g1_i3.p1 GENE.c20196_g1_i3~~c20196_g1_i3.p1  ORF type:complete len:350 (-),score=79.86 c20196_g1_i3:183-1232(-)